MQKHKTFEDAISQEVVIEQVKIQDGEIKKNEKDIQKGDAKK